jgi:predicted Zn-ribbon and HTH transcriptional regulator
MSLTPPQEGDWHTLARLDGTAPEVLGGSPEIVAGEYRIGQGKLIVVGSPTPILNGMLTQGGNLHFVLALISGNPVILDEWSHGIGHEATVIGFNRRVGLLPVLLQVLVIVILYAWSTSGFARQEDAPGQRQRSCIEQIETLGYLYSQSLDPEVTFERVYAEIQHRLAETLRCQPQEIADSLKLLDPSAKQKVEQLLERINRIGRAHGPRCRTCGYDLTLNTTGRCPECGSMVLPELQQRIREAAAVSVLPERTTRRRVRIDSDLAAILTQSHQLVQEVERDRRALR